MTPVKSFRLRYILGLSAMAVLLLTVSVIVQTTTTRQENYGRVINIAGNQLSLTNRIAFFSNQMILSTSADDFAVAQQQVARAVNRMRLEHTWLVHGNEEENIPLITTPLLDQIYHDPATGLETAVFRFLERATRLSRLEYGELGPNNADFLFISSYGPFALANLLEAVVVEYERFAKEEIERLIEIERYAVALGILVLCLEAAFIFFPLERQLASAFGRLREQRDQLAREKRTAEHANRAKTDFLSNMSHELRTPLNAIIGFAQSLSYGVYGKLADDRQHETVDAIQYSGEHLLGLVNDILDISAAESGSIVLHETNVSASDLMDQAIRIIEPLAEQHACSLAMVAPPALLSLRVDERRCVQVLINLLSNAVKFSSDGGTVTLKAFRNKDGRGGFVIADTGIGMSNRDISVAQERFGQVESIDTRSHEGSGLGLPVAIELMHSHGGTLDIDSEQGAGTTVTVTFPAVRVFDPTTIRIASNG